MGNNKVRDFEEIIESLNDLIYQLDDQGRFIYANQTMEIISGYTKKELKKIHYWELVLPEEVQALKEFYQNQAKNLQRDTYYEFTMCCKSGKQIQIGQNVSMLFNEQGEIQDIIAIARDITSIKELNKKFEEKVTEVKETGELLQAHTTNLNTQAHLLDSILNSMVESVAIYDVDGNLVKVNEAGKAMVGLNNVSSDTNLNGKLKLYYSDEETIIPDEEHPKFRLLRGEEVDNMEMYTFNPKKKLGVFIRLNGRPLKDERHNIIGAVLVGSNVTESKASESQMRKNSDLLNQAQKMALIGHWEVDLKRNTVYWSAETKRIHEVPDDYMPDLETAINFYDKESQAIITQAVQDAVDTGKGWDLKLGITTTQNHFKYVRSIGKVEMDNGRAVKLYGVFQDISKDRQREEQLIAFVDAAPAAIAMFDKKINYIAASEQWYKSYKLVGQTIIGLNHYVVFPEISEHWKKIHQQALSGEICKAKEDHFERLDGSSQWLKWEVRPWYDMSGKIGGIIMLTDDITQQKAAQEELKKAKEEAEIASFAKEEFLSTMSHEIRTPMNAVIGMTHLLLEDEKLPHQKENLKTLQFSAENLLVLINDILDFSKITSGKISLESVPFNLRELADNIRRSLKFKADEKRIRLSFIFDSDIPENLMGDPTRISQILTNLIANAIKFTEKGSVRISLQMIDENSDEVSILFSIADTGIGIPKDQQNSIFERFTQAGKATTRNFGGTGLGLAITKNLLELHKSKIHLTSEPGKGSEFMFTLHFKKVNGEVLPKNKLKYNSGIVEIANTAVLLVEDNKVNQIIACKFLEKWKIKVDTADNGRVALEKLKEKNYDLILMDLQMPVMDGYQATQEIRKNKQYDNLPIVALTADATTDIKNSVRGLGMNDFITKPFNPQELYNKIAELTNQKYYKNEIPGKTTDQEKFINFQDVEMMADGDCKFFKRILESYRNELKQFSEDYTATIQSSDIKRQFALNHKMKASFELFHSKLLAKEVTKGKKIIGSGEKKKIQSHLANITRLCRATIDILTAREKKVKSK